MAYLILGRILLACGVLCAVKAIISVWQGKKGKEILAYVCLMANFILFSTPFMALYQKPQQAAAAISMILVLGVINIIAIVIMMVVRKKRSR